MRPANHPRLRLRQYAAWTRAQPDWPQQLAKFAPRLSGSVVEVATGHVRRTGGFVALRKQFVELCGSVVGGTRIDTLVCDGFLPLLAVHAGCENELAGVWYRWFPGDLPPLLVGELHRLAVFGGRAALACHGAAQGLLGWLIDHEVRQQG